MKLSYQLTVFILLLLVSVSGQAQNQAAEAKNATAVIQTGGVKMIPIKTSHGKFNVWTKRIGNNPKIKVLLIAGGPGASHEYLECFESFFPKQAIEFIYYDQLGAGYSDNPHDTTLFKVDRVVDEVEQVRQALHLNKENLYLYGQSWGGIVAMEYALKYQQNLKALIISNMVSSAHAYNVYNAKLENDLPAPVLDSIRRYEANKDFANPNYFGLLLQTYFTRHVLRLPMDQWPEPVLRSLAKLNNDYARVALGLNQFILEGELTTWDLGSKLTTISVPTLVIGSKYDYMDPQHLKWMSAKVQHGSYLYCPNGSHFCFYDDQQVYMNGVVKFIKGVDSGRKKISFN